jgi:hypothetical protein
MPRPEGAEVVNRSESPFIRRASAWNWLVAASAGLLVMLGAATALWWVLSSQERIATYNVRGALEGIRLDLGDADVEIVGGGRGPAVEVRRTDRFAFGQPADATRAVVDGELRLTSDCPATLIGSCDASYRLRVPDNIPVVVRTASGDVRFRDFRGSARVDTRDGDVALDRWCGFTLTVRAERGEVRAGAACQAERMELRSTTGAVRAVVPPGRYHVDVDSDAADPTVRGITSADDSPFRIQALSRSGTVVVEGLE